MTDILCLEEPKFTAPKKNSYSYRNLPCNGRACANCGFCCDWYWRPNGNQKDFTKRDDATCNFNRSGSGRFYGSPNRPDRYYHDVYPYNPYPRTPTYLCVCEDNGL
jgi:hypothetical protein